MLLSCAISLIAGSGAAALFWVPLKQQFFQPLWQLANLSNPVNAEMVTRKHAETIQRIGAELPAEEKDMMLRGFESLPIWKEIKWQGVSTGSNPCPDRRP